MDKSYIIHLQKLPYRCRARGRADLPSGISSGKMQKAIRALVDFFHGRPGDIGWLFTSEGWKRI